HLSARRAACSMGGVRSPGAPSSTWRSVESADRRGCGPVRRAGGAPQPAQGRIAWAPVSTLRSGPAAGTGLATVAPDGVLLDTWYPAPVLDDDAPDVPELEKLAG